MNKPSSATPPRTSIAPPPIRARGRPRRTDADDAILRAAIEMIATEGLEAVTMHGVAERAGVARASIYLRWPNRDALITAAVIGAIGGEPFRMTGDLETDLRRGGEDAARIMARPEFRAIFPALVRELASQPGAAREASYNAMFPNRQLLIAAYRDRAASSGFRTDVEPTLAIDLIVGGLVSLALASSAPPSPEVGQQAVDVVLAGLRAHRDRPAPTG